MGQEQVNLNEKSSEELGLILIEQMGVLNQALNTISQVQNNCSTIRNLLIERQDKNKLKQTEQPLENTDDRTTTV